MICGSSVGSLSLSEFGTSKLSSICSLLSRHARRDLFGVGGIELGVDGSGLEEFVFVLVVLDW